MATPRNASSGFTLIEVLLVSLLLAFVGFATFHSVRTTIRTKEEVDQTTEILQTGRSAFALFERDIRSAFYSTAEDLGWYPRTPQELAKDKEQAKAKPLPTTYFNGRASQLLFSTRTHQRMSADVPENDFHFVNYQLERGELQRSESARALGESDRSDPSKFKTFVVLTNVKRVEFSYYDPQKDSWVDAWDTEKAEYRDTLPGAVKLEVEYTPDVESTQRRETKLETIRTIIPIAQKMIKSPLKKAAETINNITDPNNPGGVTQ